jgi:hypothetical protein
VIVRPVAIATLAFAAGATGCLTRDDEPAGRARAAHATADGGGLDHASADAALLDALDQAVAHEATPRSIGRVVGARPAVDTSRASDRAVIAATTYALDPEAPRPGPPPEGWLTAMDVAYWVRPLGGSGAPRIAGVAWYPDGRRELFFAVVERR